MCTMHKNKDTRPIVYLDVTWMNQDYSWSISWQNETGKVWFKMPIGIICVLVFFFYRRLIIVHAGCTKYGFIRSFKLVLRSNNGNYTDYHNQMTVEVFKSWFI